MNGPAVSIPKSWTMTMLGELSEATDWASSRNRAMKSGSRPYSGRRTLIATSRPSWASVAR